VARLSQELARLGALIGFEAASLVVLVHLGRRDDVAIPWSRLGPWLRDAPPEVTIGAAAWLITATATTWLIVSTVAYLAARALSLVRLAAAVARVTLPPLRRIIDRSLAVTRSPMIRRRLPRPGRCNPQAPPVSGTARRRPG